MRALLILLFCLNVAFGQNLEPSRRALTMTWDATVDNAQLDNGAGTWDGFASRNWSLNGGVLNTQYLEGAKVIFGSANGTAGTVTLNAPHLVEDVNFANLGSGNVILTGSTLTNRSGIFLTEKDARINSIIAGSNGLTKTGSGWLTIGNDGIDNTYTGNTTISAGAILALVGTSVGTKRPFGTGDISVTGGATCEVRAGSTSNAMTFTNNISLTASTFQHSDAVTNYTGNITLVSGANTINTVWSGKTPTFSGVISGSGNVSFTGSGTMVFTGSPNTYTGTTQVGISCIISKNNPFGTNTDCLASSGINVSATTNVSIASGIYQNTVGATLNLGSSGNTGTMTFANQLSTGSSGRTYNVFTGTTVNFSSHTGTGNFTKQGNGTIIITSTGNTVSGSLIIQRGILQYTSGFPNSTTYTITVSNSSPSPTTNSGRLTFASSPNLSGKTCNILITESGTGISYNAVNWSGTATNTPTLQVNGVTVTSGVPTAGGTTVTYSTTTGITVSR